MGSRVVCLCAYCDAYARTWRAFPLFQPHQGAVITKQYVLLTKTTCAINKTTFVVNKTLYEYERNIVSLQHN